MANPERQERVDCIVVGAGVIGLAIARALAQAGRETVILEANVRIGEETSSRSNEVIHAGFLYPPGSLKERLCQAGSKLLYAYCAERGIGHSRIGKLIPAVNARQLPMLDELHANARRVGVRLDILTAAEVRPIEPALHCLGAVFSPDTGIVDSHAFMVSLLGDAQAKGAVLAVGTQVESIVDLGGDGFVVTTRSDGGLTTRISCNMLINAAGLDAHRLASTMAGGGGRNVPPIFLAKGVFCGYRGRPPFAHLVVPLAETLAAGASLTWDLAGGARFGPDLSWVERRDYAPTAQPERFAAAIASWWPDVDASALAATYAGIRPRTSGPGEPPADWCVQGPSEHGVPNLVHLLAMDSPGLTCCLAIADHVLGLLGVEASDANASMSPTTDHAPPVSWS